MAMPVEERARLLEHFKDVPQERIGEQWSKLWEAGDFLPWDRGIASPSLSDALNDRRDLLGDSAFVDESGTQRRRKAFVPGCGKGHDVLLFASHGFDAYGLDISEKAVQVARDFAKAHLKDYPVKDAAVGVGTVTFISGDFFSKDWEKEVKGGPKFEVIFDYTFLCALSPSMRPEWAERMSSLLVEGKGGNLICLEFPTYKDPATGGPPHGLPGKVYKGHLSHPGKKLSYDSDGNLEEEKIEPGVSKNGFVLVKRWKPERTHKAGEGTDMMSVWTRDS